MIFISGIHGVGKTYFCDSIKEKLGIDTYSASKLIEKKKDREFSGDKLVGDIDENQMLLLEAIDELRKRGEESILDGHFCLLDKDGFIARIPMETYISLKPDKIVLLMEQPAIIVKRRLQRDGIILDETSVDSFQREEMIYAEEVAKELNIQLIVSMGSSDLEDVIQKIREGRY